MAWIEMHQSLPTHRKTMQLARALGLKVPRDIPQAVGHLGMLWLWAIDNVPDGDLTGIHPEDIANAAGWTKGPDVLVSALRESGFVGGDGRIHDWDMYIGKLIDKRTENARRNREARARKKDPSASRDASRDSHADTNGDITSASRDGATVPNRTQPYRTQPNHTPVAPVVAGADAPDRPFDEFWSAYPKKVGRIAAKKAWGKVNAEARKRIPAAIERAKASEQWTRDNGQFIPNPATWLNQGRWDDEPPSINPYKSGQADTDPSINPFRRSESSG